MGKWARWLPVLAVPLLLGMTGMPAFARGMRADHGPRASWREHRSMVAPGGHGSPFTALAVATICCWAVARDRDLTCRLGSGRICHTWQDRQSVLTDAASGDDAPANRYVIVISGQPPSAPQRTPVAASGSVSVGGCYPIPNGYHCDSPQHGAAP